MKIHTQIRKVKSLSYFELYTNRGIIENDFYYYSDTGNYLFTQEMFHFSGMETEFFERDKDNSFIYDCFRFEEWMLEPITINNKKIRNKRN